MVMFLHSRSSANIINGLVVYLLLILYFAIPVLCVCACACGRVRQGRVVVLCTMCLGELMSHGNVDFMSVCMGGYVVAMLSNISP
jgi:hypothetical protein